MKNGGKTMSYEEIWKTLKAEALRDAQMGLYDEMERLEKQSLEKEKEQQPNTFDFKEYLNQWKKIYPLILDEVKQMEREFNQMCKPKPVEPSQRTVCGNCKYIIKQEGQDDAYANCAASTKFNCVTGKSELEHCYMFNGEGNCQKYEPQTSIKNGTKKEE